MYLAGPSAAQAASSGGGSQSASQSLDATFAQLLVAQLKSQDPLNPMDPSQFVSQLVGLNTLDAVSNIYQLLKDIATIPAYAGAEPPSAKAAGGN